MSSLSTNLFHSVCLLCGFSLLNIVDGLACAFLVGAQDVLNYNLFYDCVIATLGLGTNADLSAKSTPRHVLEKCASHYHFIVAWRLLGCLPPSPKYLGEGLSLKITLTCLVVRMSLWIDARVYLFKKGRR